MSKNLIASIGLLTVVVIIFVNARRTDESLQVEGYEIGDVVADFSLKNVDGEMMSMSGMKDAKGFIVIFTCNTCPYSKMYESRIDQLNLKYKSKGYPVMAINSNDKDRQPDDSYEAMISLSNEKNYSFPYLYDETQEVAKAFGATRTPHVYLVNKENGKLITVYIGGIDNNAKDASAVTTKYTEDAIDNLLAGEKVVTNFTKAIGCTIKWKES